MYQTVMILLVTAVITIITTVVTVRVTMTGRVVSQETKSRLKALGIRYGMIAGNLFNIGIHTFNLISLMMRTRPISRSDILLISLTVCLLVFAFFGLVIGIVFAWFHPRLFQRIHRSA